MKLRLEQHKNNLTGEVDLELKMEIEMLLTSKREGDYWDFKQKHHANKAALLHDIICMANNRADRDAYIIYGVVNDTYEVVGVENDENRKKQQNIIDLLKEKKFSSGIRPPVEMRTVKVQNHEVDVLIIKNNTDTPYFLIEEYRDQKEFVRAHHIYTRVGDTNTAIDKSADINIIEYLWKKRFLLTRSPFEQVKKKLKDRNNWEVTDDTYFNMQSPEFTIKLDDQDQPKPEFYSYAMMNESTQYQTLRICYYGTTLFDTQVAVLDGGRYKTPVPKWGFLHFNDRVVYQFKYFVKDDLGYILNEFFYNDDDHEESEAHSRFFDVVLLFYNSQEKCGFMNYVQRNQQTFIEKLTGFESEYSGINSGNKENDEKITTSLRAGKALNLMLSEYRKQR